MLRVKDPYYFTAEYDTAFEIKRSDIRSSYTPRRALLLPIYALAVPRGKIFFYQNFTKLLNLLYQYDRSVKQGDQLAGII